MEVICNFIAPQEYKKLGSSFVITYGFYQTLFGKCLIAITNNKICHLAFVNNSEQESLQILKDEWYLSSFNLEEFNLKNWVQKIFKIPNNFIETHILMKGSSFQINVWKTLIGLPRNTTISYEDVAKKTSNPKATRAVASAIARNSIAYLVPCHLVIRKSGQIHNYRWGIDYKKALILADATIDSNLLQN